MTPSEETECHATGYLPTPSTNAVPTTPEASIPDLVGMRFAEARRTLRSRQVEFEWLRAYDHPRAVSDWLVCYQGKADIGSYVGEEFVLRLVVTLRCPERFPSIVGLPLGVAEKRLDTRGIGYSLLDAGDDDFPQDVTSEAKSHWVACYADVNRSIRDWLSGNTGNLYSNGDVLGVDLYVAPDGPGCNASNEAEEQGEG